MFAGLVSGDVIEVGVFEASVLITGAVSVSSAALPSFDSMDASAFATCADANAELPTSSFFFESSGLETAELETAELIVGVCGELNPADEVASGGRVCAGRAAGRAAVAGI